MAIGESTLRNILGGALPRADILVAIAEAGNVTVDWLATGRLPKTRAELRAALGAAQPAAPACQATPNATALGYILAGVIAAKGPSADPLDIAHQAVTLYLRAIGPS